MNTKNLHIRNYQTADFEEVEALWLETGMGGRERGDTPEVIEKTLKIGGKLFVLENKSTKEIVGTSWLSHDGRRIYLHHFGIKPELQGKGFSKILLKESLNFAKESGMQIKLEVHQENFAATQLYRKGGFNYLGDYDVYIMRDYELLKKKK